MSVTTHTMLNALSLRSMIKTNVSLSSKPLFFSFTNRGLTFSELYQRPRMVLENKAKMGKSFPQVL